MEVPERTLNFMFLAAGDHAARMFNPGAVTSGYVKLSHSQNFSPLGIL